MEQYAKTDYVGIDYGMRTSNINIENDIRYGVIPHHDVGSAWYDEAESHYGDPTCPHCGQMLEEMDEDVHAEFKVEPDAQFSEFACENCELIIDEERVYPDEPLSWFVKNDEYEAEQTGEVDIFIFKSPYFTYAQLCSPCAPGACYLPSPLFIPDINNKCYCLGPEWFEDEQPPYPVYSIKTNQPI